MLPARDPAHTAEVRIFTPDREVPFAGHPNVGTAVVLARELAASGRPCRTRSCSKRRPGWCGSLRREGADVNGAELQAPQPLSRRALAPVDAVARALRLAPGDIETAEHAPQVVSVGLTFLVVQLASRVALRRASPDPAGYAALPLDDARSIYAYTTDTAADTGQGPTDIQARMFTGRMTEDPATGSATAAAARCARHSGRRDHAATAGGAGRGHGARQPAARPCGGPTGRRVGGRGG